MSFRFSTLLAAICLAAFVPHPLDASTAKPNILLLIGDDIDYSYYGFQGHELAVTPNLDQLAAEGVVFENGYATASVCQPSLRSLLAGIRSYTWERMKQLIRKVHGDVPYRRESRHVYFTLPRLLRVAGYKSFAGGKMWEGTYEDAGFDAGTMEKVKFIGVDGADRFGRESLQPLFDFIDSQTEPWFAWVAPALPHHPFDPSEELMDLYRGKGLLPGAVRYFGNLSRLDRRFGEIRAFLDERGLTDNTVIIYVGDNGWETRLRPGSGLASTIGGDRGKLSVHDRGFRTPIIVRWPAEIAGGNRLDPIVTFEDVYATILDYAGARSHVCSRGASFRHIAKHGHGTWHRRHVLLKAVTVRNPIADVRASRLDDNPDNDLAAVSNEDGIYMRRGRKWAYSYVPGRDFEQLFHLMRDPMGDHDLAVGRRDLLGAMRRRALAMNEEIESIRCMVLPADTNAIEMR